ncbi:MAG: DsbA family protein [Anaerolineaceae bacterium]|nr:DsbA family protein [Anaerolineaceae bacterium]
MSTNVSKRELLRQNRIQQKRHKTITFLLVSLAAVILILLLIFLPDFLLKLSSAGFPLGDPNAPVTVYEFSSYTCSHCYDFNVNAAEDFIAKYVDTGKVYFVYVNLPANNESSLLAAEASYCAEDQGKFYEFKDQIFPYSAGGMTFTEASLANFASLGGLDVDAFQSCMASDKFISAYDQDISFASASGVTATPTFLVNGQDLVTVNDLEATIEKYLNN